jgi:hypothetical protein
MGSKQCVLCPRGGSAGMNSKSTGLQMAPQVLETRCAQVRLDRTQSIDLPAPAAPVVKFNSATGESNGSR